LASADRVIAFIVPRYGPRVVGGAETLCRLVAEDLAAAGLPVEVFTTCAVDHFTWANDLPEGSERLNGVLVHRFPVCGRDAGRFADLHHHVARAGTLGYLEQVEWMAHSVASTAMLDALEARADIRVRFALPYLFGTTYWAAQQDPARTVLIPCLHDEPYAHLRIVRDMLGSVRGCLANAPGEARLIGRLAPTARVAEGGVGFDFPEDPPDVAGFCASRGIAPGYVLYAGRREEAKGVPLLYDGYARLRELMPQAPPLALMGSGDLPVPEGIAPHVVELGFVPEDEVRAARAAASVLVQPSRLESLGMAMLECWIEGVPAVVNAGSEVMADHCAESGAGLVFADADDLADAVARVLDDPAGATRMADAGREYVRRRYSWPAVRGRYLDAVEAWS